MVFRTEVSHMYDVVESLLKVQLHDKIVGCLLNALKQCLICILDEFFQLHETILQDLRNTCK